MHRARHEEGRRNRPSQMAGRRRVACAVVALIAFASLTSPAWGGTGRSPARKVTFTTASGPPIPSPTTCDSAGVCLAPISGGPESTVTGDWEGTGVYAGAALLVSDSEAISSAMATFTGTVKGCGEGTLTTRYDAHYSADLPHGGGGRWEIVAGVGTGDLRGVTGRGTFTVGQTNPDFSGTNDFKGVIRC